MSLSWVLENVLFIVTGAIVVIQGYGFVNLFWCLVLARASAAIFNLLVVHYYVAPLRFQIDWGFFREFLPPLAIFGVSSLAYQVFMRIDVVMLSKMTDMDTVGLYSSAANLMEVCTLVLIIFYILNLPAAAKGYRTIGTQIHDRIESNASQLFILVFLVFGFGFCFAQLIMPLVYGSSFVEADWILRILMVAFLIQAAESILAMSCLASDHHREVMYVVVGRAVVNIGLNLVFIPMMGALGAALATALSILFSLVAFQIFMKRSLGSLRWIRMLGKPALACLLVIGLLFPLADHVDAFLLGGVFLAGYGFLVFALNGFSTATG
jgi:PST family polysaccharide transporter